MKARGRRPGLFADPELTQFLGAIAVVIAFVGLVPAIVRAVVETAWIELGVWSALCLFVVAAVVRYVRTPVPAPPLPTTDFEPLAPAEALRAPWPRDDAVQRLLHQLSSQPLANYALLVGPSGAGKTVLVQRLLPDALARSAVATTYVDSYASYRERLDALLLEAGPTEPGIIVPRLLILDQFEQFLASLQELPAESRRDEEEWLRTYLSRVERTPWLRVLICLRSEWYFDLHFLGEFTPAMRDTSLLLGPDPEDAESRAIQALRGRLESAAPDPTTADQILLALGHPDTGRLIPIEAQIVGATLERASASGSEVTVASFLDRNGGIAGAIDTFFDAILDGAPDRRVALKVLCAFSVKTQFRREETLATLKQRLFEDSALVDKTVAYLEGQALLVSSKPGRYTLRHDYLAQAFHDKSGAELDPFDRDNVLFHFSTPRKPLGHSVRSVDGQVVPRQTRLCAWIFLPTFAIILARLLYLGIPWTSLPGGPDPRFLSSVAFFDLTYLPIFLAHIAWLLYVWLLYDRVYAYVAEDGTALFFSRVVVVNTALAVIAGALFPYAWLLCIGWAGIVAGFKMVMIGRMPTNSTAARRRFSQFGWLTVANLAFLSALGAIALAASLQYVGSADSQLGWLVINSFLAVIMIYICIVFAPLHVRHEGATQLVGVLARSPRGSTRGN